MDKKIKIGINGFGTIGKRVALAIKNTDDMELLGIVKTKPDYNAILAKELGIGIFVPSEEYLKNFEDYNIRCNGTLEDLIEKSDVIIDATPAGIGIKNKEIYKKHNKKAVFQGGEKTDVAEVSFTAQVNYEQAINKHYVRVVSCNTTALSRTLNAIKECIKGVNVTIIRRAADPEESSKGPINSIIATFNSHHASDIKTVLPIEEITTNSYVVPTTLMHMHDVCVELNQNIPLEKILYLFENTERVLLLDINDSAKIMDFAKNLNRGLGGDLYEVAVLRNSIRVKNEKLYFTQAVHQESIVVPENIDAIRAMLNIAEREKSIRKTNESLGILNEHYE